MKKALFTTLLFLLTASPAFAEVNLIIDNVVIERDGQEVKRPIPINDFVDLIMQKIESLEEMVKERGEEPVNTLTVDQTLSVGMSGEEVLDLQKILNSMSATQVSENGPGSPGNETQYFGTLTKSAVIKFQGLHDLPLTGMVDDATMDAINAVYAR